MKRSKFGMMVASAVASLIGSAALAETGQAGGTGETKACYRQHCGKSVQGHEGQCGGTRVEDLTSQPACENAGGAWTTESDAAKFKKES